MLTAQALRLPYMHEQAQSDKRAQILGCLCEGNSIRATARLVDCSINTVVKLLIDAGRACTKFQTRRCGICTANTFRLTKCGGSVGAKTEFSKEKKAQVGARLGFDCALRRFKLLATWLSARASLTPLIIALRSARADCARSRVQITRTVSPCISRRSFRISRASRFRAVQKIYGAEPTPQAATARHNAWGHVAL